MKQGKFIFYFKTLKSNLYSFVIYKAESRRQKVINEVNLFLLYIIFRYI